MPFGGRKRDGEMSEGLGSLRRGGGVFQGGEGSGHGGFGHSVLEEWLWLEENGVRNVGKMRKEGNRQERRRTTS